jgi:hypothetical protein
MTRFVDFTVLKKPDYMKFAGTCLQGYVKAGYSLLFALFGKPTAKGSAEQKHHYEWHVAFDDGVVAMIYDCDLGRVDPAKFAGVEFEWHIGGSDKRALKNVKAVIAASTSVKVMK